MSRKMGSRRPMRGLVLAALALVLLGLPRSSLAEPTSAIARRPPWRLHVPVRPAPSEGGRAFLERIEPSSPAEYEEETRRAILAGNVPSFERELEPVWLEGVDRRGVTHKAVIYVLRDYLAVGSDEDFALVPMTPATAQDIADATDTLLPTRKMVDAIYASAPAPLAPRWIPGGPVSDARDHRDFKQHKLMLDAQRRARKVDLQSLMAGDKKDVVLARDLAITPDRVAIYGWHRRVDQPVQPFAMSHCRTYVDYSHGVRLVARRALVDGELRDLHEVLVHPELAWAVSDEGPLTLTRYPRPRLLQLAQREASRSAGQVKAKVVPRGPGRRSARPAGR